MKKLSIGIQSFEKLREGDYTYVDKTQAVYGLAHSGGCCFFLSRPRRFGKSLLLSTLKAYFEGKKELFEGLDIMKLEHDWTLVETLDKPELNNAFRERMRSMYSVLKTCDAHIHFALLTGVSRFKDLGVFSGLNNLEDITLDSSVATICGFTENELRDNFGEHISAFAKQEDIGEEALVEKLKQMYDGYCFDANAEGVFNPFSLLVSLKQKRLGNYWYQSGTTSWLMKQLDVTTDSLEQFSDDRVVARTLVDDARIGDNPIALLYQTGYLTIKGYDREFDSYRLGFPIYTFLSSRSTSPPWKARGKSKSATTPSLSPPTRESCSAWRWVST